VLVGGVALAATVFIGLSRSTFDATPGDGGIPAGANRFMLVLAVGLLVGFLFYEAIEWLQTRRLDSIARQFSTRTIALMPVAIALNIVLGQTVGTALKLPVYLDSIGTIVVGVLAGPIAGAATGLLSNLAWTFVLAGTPFGSPFAWPFAIVAAEIGLVAGVFGYLGFFRPRPGTPPAKLAGWVAAAVVLLGGLVWFGILPFYRNLCAADPGQPASPATLCFQLFAPDTKVEPMFLLLGAAIAAVIVVALLAFALRLLRERDLGIAFVVVAGTIAGLISASIAAPIAAVVFGGVTASGTDLLVAAFQYAGSDLQLAVLQQSIISDSIDKTVSYVIVFTLLASLSRRLTARFPQGERALGTVEG
jgi:hypothetical protein